MRTCEHVSFYPYKLHIRQAGYQLICIEGRTVTYLFFPQT
jgi:hypothetical protein